jgi:hypothetical protein
MSKSRSTLLSGGKVLQPKVPSAQYTGFVGFLSKSLCKAALTLVALLRCGDISMANDTQDILRELRGATHAILLLVPYRTSFRARITEFDLPDVACAYEVSAKSQVFDELLDAIRARIVFLDDFKPEPDLRVGVVFRSASNTIRDFYLNDLGGFREIEGFTGDRHIRGAADLPNYLRSLAIKPDVSLVRDVHSRCPHG